MEKGVDAENVLLMNEDLDNIDKWIKFLDPENLKGNLMFSSLYIATYESFKEYIIETVKYFYHKGWNDGKDIFSRDYDTRVLSKSKYPVMASLLWLKELEAIDEADIDLFGELREYRNKLSHQLMELLFEGLPKELPKKFSELIALRIQIEKWWALNIDIPTNPDLDLEAEINEESIVTHTQIFSKLIFDIILEDEKKAKYYQDELKKHFNR